MMRHFINSLQWRRNEHDTISNPQPRDCLLNYLFRHRWKKHQSSVSLAFVWGIHRWPVNSPHNWPVMRKMFPFDDVIMYQPISSHNSDQHNPSCYWIVSIDVISETIFFVVVKYVAVIMNVLSQFPIAYCYLRQRRKLCDHRLLVAGSSASMTLTLWNGDVIFVEWESFT